MKKFIIWLIITLVVFAGLFGVLHFTFSNNPKRIIVAVDTSIGMKKVDYRVKSTIKKLLGRRYSVYTLITDKSKLAEWKTKPVVPRDLKYYGPQDLTRFEGMKNVVDFNGANQVYFITNKADQALKDSFPGAKIIVIN